MLFIQTSTGAKVIQYPTLVLSMSTVYLSGIDHALFMSKRSQILVILSVTKRPLIDCKRERL